MMNSAFSANNALPLSVRAPLPLNERAPRHGFTFQFHLFGNREGENAASKFVTRLELSDVIDFKEEGSYDRIWYHDDVRIHYLYGFGTRSQRVWPLDNQWEFSSGREAVIIVLDSTSSMEDIKESCRYAGVESVRDRMSFRNVVIMIVADKQDVEGAHSPEEIESAIREMAMNRWHGNPWFVVPCRSLTNDDVKVAYRYLRKMSRLNSKGQLKPSLIPTAYAWEQANQIEVNEEDEEDYVPLGKSQGMINSLETNLLPFKSLLLY